MPGAARLLWHLHSHGIPMALATSTPRATYEAKMCGKAAQSLCSIFQASTLPAPRLRQTVCVVCTLHLRRVAGDIQLCQNTCLSQCHGVLRLTSSCE